MMCAIVLAAGQSLRMGTQKLLLPFAGTTLIGRIVDELARSAVDAVYVVVGPRADSITRELKDRDVRVVANPIDDGEMLSSVRCGLEALPPQCDAVLVALGDQPSLTTALVDEMIRSYAKTERGILVPVYGGRRGHPLLFSAHYRNEILTQYDNVGLRGLLQAHNDDVAELPASDAVLTDVDSPKDYRRAIVRQRAQTEMFDLDSAAPFSSCPFPRITPRATG
jgi:molybdenum cofactor cytidylyltransferase